MKQYDIFAGADELFEKNADSYVTYAPNLSQGVVFDKRFLNSLKDGAKYGARALKCIRITEDCDLPARIIGFYKVEDGLARKCKYADVGAFAVYSEILPGSLNLVNPKAAQYAFSAAALKNPSAKFYCVNNDFFAPVPVWSSVIKKAYMQKYGQDITENLIMLFEDAKGCKRFRNRYYALTAELVTDNFLRPLKDICVGSGISLYGSKAFSLSVAEQVLPNNALIGICDIYDKLFLYCPAELLDGAFLRRYIRFFTSFKPQKIAAVFSDNDIKKLSLKRLAAFADRLLAGGIRQFCIPQGTAQKGTDGKKAQILKKYIQNTAALLDTGERISDVLAIYPYSSAAGNFCANNIGAVKEFNTVTQKGIDLLNRADILYDVASERSLGQEIKISGALISAANNKYTCLVLLPCDTLTPTAAGFILKYTENGGRVYCIGEKPLLIDGVQNSRIDEISQRIKRIGAKEISQLRAERTPLFDDNGIDVYCCKLPDGSKLSFAANINGDSGSVSFASFENIAAVDTVNRELLPVNLSNKIGKVAGKQVIDLKNFENSHAVFRIGDIPLQKPKQPEYLNLSPYFDLTDSGDNTFVINKCSVRKTNGKWSAPTCIKNALKNMQRASRKNITDLKFDFEIRDCEKIGDMLLYFENQALYSVFINDIPVKTAGEPTDIREFVKEGVNSILIRSESLVQRLKTEETTISCLFISGKFAVVSTAPVRNEKFAVRTKNEFVITALPAAVNIERLTENGFWFFGSDMLLTQRFTLEEEPDSAALLRFKKFNALCACVCVNGVDTADIWAPPFKTNVGKYLRKGENEISIRIFADNTNLHALDGITDDNVSLEPLGAVLFTGDEEQTDYICLKDVTKTYVDGGKTIYAVRDADINIGIGEFTVIYGPTGSGKTTLLNIIGGIDTCDSGTVCIEENDINEYSESRLADYRRKNISFIFKDGNLLDYLTVNDNITLFCDSKNQVLDNRLVLRSVGLEDKADCTAAKLTLCEQQKAAIAGAVAKNPQIILCDEPLGKLKQSDAAEVLNLLRETCRLTGKTVIIATNNKALCAAADRVITISDGCITANEVNPKPAKLEEIEW